MREILAIIAGFLLGFFVLGPLLTPIIIKPPKAECINSEKTHCV